jgi:hypothetical protein
MTLPPNKNDREQDKFIWDPDNTYGTMVKVLAKLEGGVAIGDVNIKAPTGPFRVQVFTVTTTATDFIPIPLVDRVSISIRNKSATQTVYFGEDNTITADDTATGGWEIGPGEDFNIDLNDTNAFYLMTSSGTATVKILEIAST